MLPSIAWRISASVGSALLREQVGGGHDHARGAEAALQAVLLPEARSGAGAGRPPSPSPSIVVTLEPSAWTASIVQLFTALPSTWTVQAPHWLVSQPTWVPVRSRSSRSTWTRSRLGSTSTSRVLAVHLERDAAARLTGTTSFHCRAPVACRRVLPAGPQATVARSGGPYGPPGRVPGWWQGRGSGATGCCTRLRQRGPAGAAASSRARPLGLAGASPTRDAARRSDARDRRPARRGDLRESAASKPSTIASISGLGDDERRATPGARRARSGPRQDPVAPQRGRDQASGGARVGRQRVGAELDRRPVRPTHRAISPDERSVVEPGDLGARAPAPASVRRPTRSSRSMMSRLASAAAQAVGVPGVRVAVPEDRPAGRLVPERRPDTRRPTSTPPSGRYPDVTPLAKVTMSGSMPYRWLPEHRADPAEPGDHLVGDEQDVVARGTAAATAAQ